jgi:hypothetical protein
MMNTYDFTPGASTRSTSAHASRHFSARSLRAAAIVGLIMAGTASISPAFAAKTKKAICLQLTTGEVQMSAVTAIDSITFNAAHDSMLVVRGGEIYPIALSNLAGITYSTLPSVVSVTYADSVATVENPFAFDGVEVAINGADVTVTSSASDEVEYELSGASSDGCFKIYSDKKYQITLRGLDLTNADGPAINSQSSKKGTIKVQGSTFNNLCDAKKYAKAVNGEEQKGTIFSEGQLIFKGAGTLHVTGLNKHAICSDDYIEVDNSTIKVLAAASDAFHANDSILFYGGRVSLTASGDGVDCEGPVIFAPAATDTLDITLPGDDVACLKSDTLVEVRSGVLILTTTGASSKAIKSKGDVRISGGDITITQSGDMTVEDGDAGYSSAIKASGNIEVTGGNIVIVNDAEGGKGLTADGNISISDGVLNIAANGRGGIYDPTSTSTPDTAKASYIVYVSLPTTTSSQGGGWGGWGGGPGGQSSNNAWSAVHLYKSDGTLVATLSSTATITASNGSSATFYYYNFKAADNGTYYFASDDYVAQQSGVWGGWGGNTAYSIRTNDFSGPTSGTGVYYSIPSSYSTSGTVRTYTMTDVTATYSGGSLTASSSEGENYFAACLKADGDIFVSGGTLQLSHSGAMSKGIRCDGTFTLSGGEVTLASSGSAQIVNNDPSYSTGIKVGNYVGTGGTVTIEATGFAGRAISVDGNMTVSDGTYTLTCSGNGGTYTNASRQTDGYGACGIKTDGNLTLEGGTFTIRATGKGGKGIHADGTATFGTTTGGAPTIDVATSGTVIANSGGGMSDSFIGSAKAIKIEGNIVINDGNILAKTTSNGGEGIESKASITFNGGTTECDTYDDGINAATKITFNGGIIYSHATGNDGIDCNGSAGFEFNGGVIIASGTSSPEEGFDCDNSKFVINGGLLIGTGGSTSSPTSAKQPYTTKSGIQVTSGKYLSVKKSDGTVLFSYRCPVSVNSATVLLSSPDFTSGTSYSLVYGATAVSNPTETSLSGVFTRGGTLTGGSTTSFTPATR